MIRLPSKFDQENVFEFYIKLKENFNLGKELITHIKLSEYSIMY